MNALRDERRLPALFVLLILIGCRSGANAARQQETSHLRSLVSLHNFAASKLGHRPANEAEFKSFIAANAKPVLESLKVENVDALFVSERDGQPFVVLYGKPPTGAAADVVAYEQSGVDGQRLVGFALGIVEEVNDQRFAEIVAVAGKRGK